MSGPIIRIDQAANSAPTGPAGEARDDIWLNQPVSLVSSAETPPNTSWQWTLLDKPPGSAAALSGATTATATFTPDVVGTYRVKLQTGTDAQIRIIGVVRDSAGVVIRRGWRIPALDEGVSDLAESNVGGQLRGWDPAFRAMVGDIDTALARTARVITVGPAGSNATYLTDGVADEVQINAAIVEANGAGGGKVLLLPGTYTIAAQVNLLSNVVLAGSGQRTTLIVVATGFLNTNTWAIGCAGALTTGTAINLASNAAQGATTLVATAGAEFNAIAALDYLMLISDALWESTNLSLRERGEFVRVASLASPNIVIYGMVRDAYNTADTARLYRVSFVEACGVQDLSIRQEPALDTRAGLVPPMISLQMSRNSFVRNCEVYNSDGPGITVYHSVQTLVENNNVHDLTDNSPSSRLGYGMLIGGATENCVVYGNRFSRTRHAVDAGPSVAASGFAAVTNNGIPRAVAVVGNTALHIANVPYSTHSEAEGWLFADNIAEASESCGFFMRGRSCSVIGNTVQWCSGGIQIGNNTLNSSGGSGSGCHVVGNTIRHIKSITPGSTGTNFGGYGIILALTDNVLVRGNTISACDAAGIRMRQYARRCSIIANTIQNANLLNTANMPAVEFESPPNGTTATLTLSGTTITATGLANLASNCVGKTIVVSGATTPGNNGSFVITSFISATSCTWENAAGATDANNGAISWYVESISDNVFNDNAAMNTVASEYDRDVTGHAKYMFRDPGTAANTRNSFVGNRATGMETDFMAVTALHYSASNMSGNGVVQHGNEKQVVRDYPISKKTTDATPTQLFLLATTTGRNYIVQGYIQGTNGGGGRWYYSVDAFFDNNAGTLTQRLASPVTEKHESSSSVTLAVQVNGTSIEVLITSLVSAVSWTGRLTISEARVGV